MKAKKKGNELLFNWINVYLTICDGVHGLVDVALNPCGKGGYPSEIM